MYLHHITLHYIYICNNNMIVCAVYTETETHHHMSLHYLTSHYIPLHHITSHYIIYYLLCAVFTQKEQHTIAFHWISLHHTSHYIILHRHNITSRYITLDDLYTFMYKMILWYTCIYIYNMYIYIYTLFVHMSWEWPVVLRLQKLPRAARAHGRSTDRTDVWTCRNTSAQAAAAGNHRQCGRPCRWEKKGDSMG